MTTILIISAFLLGIALKLPFVNSPLDRDYGIYGYHALFWLKGRKTPYRDTNENHPPGRWLFYALLIKFFPISRNLFRYSNLVFLVVTNIIVFLIADTLFGTMVALMATVCFAVLSSLPTFVWTQSSDEIQQILFTSLVVLGIVVTDSSNSWLYFGIGFASFMALFFKQSAYINTFPVMVIALLIKGTAWVLFLWVFSGIAMGYGLTWIFFKQQNVNIFNYQYVFALNFQAFKSHLENILYRRKPSAEPEVESPDSETDSQTEAYAMHNNSQRAHRAWIFKIVRSLTLQTNLFLFLTAVTALLSVSQWNSTPVIWIWLAMTILAIIMNRHTMPIHFIPLLAPLAILSGIGLVSGFNWLLDQGGVWWGAGVSTGLLGFSLFLMRNEIQQWIKLEKKGRGHIYVSDQEWEYNSAGEGVGKYLVKQGKPDDQIYVWGPEYEVYLWSGRSSPTRSLFCPRPQVSFSPDPFGAEKDIVDQLTANLPKFIVITALTEGFEKFERLLNDQYFLERKMYGEFEIHKRNDAMLTSISEVKTSKLQPLASIIMLTYNALDYSKQCVDSIQKSTRYPYELIFVDNASSDGTVTYLTELIQRNPNYHLIKNDSNRGFAAGNNQGMEIAKGDYLLLLNNDVLVPIGWLEGLVACAEMDPNIGLVGPLTNWISGWQMVIDVPYTETKDFTGYANKIAETQANRYTPRRRIAGFAMLIKRALYETIGGLDEQFGSGNYEDDDYCLRARNEGFKIMVAEDVYIHHFGSKTFQENNIDYSRSIMKNKALFRQKWSEIKLDWLMEKNGRLTEINAVLVNKGMVAMKQGYVDQAIDFFTEVLDTNPIDGDALFGLGVAYQQSRENDKAIHSFSRCIKVVPNHKEVNRYLGLLYLEKRDLGKALASFTNSLKLDPGDRDLRKTIAEVLIQLERYDAGERMLNSVLTEQPEDIPTLLQIAQLYTKAGQIKYARQFANQVLRYEPMNEEALRIRTVRL